ncbi:radical SAM protein [Hydrogenophaga sp. XSHU_21]
MRIASTSPKSHDGSQKFLLEMPDMALVETVYLPENTHYGICASTQVGCNMGCLFCATGLQRVQRSLCRAEIVGQVRAVAEAVKDRAPLHFVTLAGMGEPLSNYANSVGALREIHEEMQVPQVSLSTIGFAEKIRQLGRECLQLRLYWSLHAPTDALRRRLIPMAAHSTIGETLDAVSAFGERHGAANARVSYLLLGNVNDGGIHLKKVCNLLRGRPVTVQLLLWNNVPGLQFERVRDGVPARWEDALRADGIDAYTMASKGREISAACGQLVTRNVADEAGLTSVRSG